MSFDIGSVVETEKGRGRVAYFGLTQFADGIWVGVELETPTGKNNGTVKGVKYFECETNYGVFVRATQVKLMTKSRSQAPSGMRLPSAARRETSKNKFSPSGSPGMTPSSSTEKLRSHMSGSLGNLSSAKKPGISRDDSKQPTLPRVASAIARPSHTQTHPASEMAAPETPAIPRPTAAPVAASHPAAAPVVSSLPEAPQTPDRVKDIVKKMEEMPLSVPLVPSGMSESSELEFLRIQNKDLTEKLDSLRAKRKEDFARIVDYDRVCLQLQSHMEFKAKMTEAHTQLRRELQEKEKELKEALESRVCDHDGVSELEEQLELVTLDKEMAEEKAEMLQAEVAAQKERMEELETDLEILRTEMEQAKGGAVQGNSVQMKQLEQQNEKLREALVKMRDVTGQATMEKAEAAKEIEHLKNETAMLVKLVEKQKKDAEANEQTVSELKEQVDAAMGSERMIERLSEKNLDMEEKIRSLEEQIEDFEAIRSMDEEIIETQKEAEKEVRQELDLAYGKINELALQLKSCAAQADDYEKTILKFRKRVGELNEDIQEHKDQILRLEEEVKKEQEDTNLSSIRSAGIVTASRTFAEVVESELKSVELEFALQHAKYLKAFLPDNFTKPGGDNDVVILNVLFPRTARKAAVLSKLLNDKYASVPGGMRREHITQSHKAEQWAHIAKFDYLLSSFGCILRKIFSAIQTCSVERISRLAHLQLEMGVQERMIDQFFELLKTNRLDENTSTDGLEKGVLYFQNLFSVYLAGEVFDTNQYLGDLIAQLLAGLNWLKINSTRISFFVPEEENEVTKLSAELLACVAECEQLSVRSRNRLPSDKNLQISSEFEKLLGSAVANFEKAATIVNNVNAIASTQLSMLTDVEGLDVDHVKEILLGVAEKIYGQVGSTSAQDVVKNYLYSLRGLLVLLADELDKGSMEIERPEKKPFPPLLDRAHTRKQDAVEAEGLRWQIEKKENEIVELKKALRSKTDDISNYRLRLEIADKKIETSGKADESRSLRLRTRCEELQNDLQKANADYEETLDALQKELEASEKENAELKERIKNMSKKALLVNLSNNLNQAAAASAISTPSSASGAMTSPTAELAYLESLLAERQMALKSAYSLIRQMKARETLRLLSEMKPIVVPTVISGPLTLAAAQNADDDVLNKMMREADMLEIECRKYQVPFVWDLRKPKEVIEADELEYNTQIKNLAARIDNLKFRIQRYWSKCCPGEPLPKLFDSRPIVAAEGKPTEVTAEKKSRGLDSKIYKDAYAKLFGNLKADRQAFEERRKARASLT